MDVQTIEITKHSVNRFVTRHLLLFKFKLKCPEKTIRELLKKAKPERIREGFKVQRLIKYKFKDAIYLTSDGWRFVITRDKNKYTLVTIERTTTKHA